MKFFLSIAAALGFIAVALGAFGAHALKDKLLPNMLEAYKTGVQYQFYHVFAIIGVALLLNWFPENKMLSYAGYLFIAGIVLFSGSLYTMAITEVRALGAITPFGGLCFLAGWALLLVSAMKMK